MTRILLLSSQCLLVARALASQVCDTPLLRADVTRLDSLCVATPLEDKGPFSSCHLLAENTCHACLPLREVQALGQDIRQLEFGRDSGSDKPHVAILNYFMREVLANVNVLGSFPTPDDVVSPFNARSVVLLHRCWGLLTESHVLEKVTQVDDFSSSSRCRVVLCLCCRQRCRLLHLRAP